MTRFAFDRLPEDALIQADSGTKHAADVLDRAAHLRGDAEAQKAALEAGRIFPIWRGRVLLDAKGAPVHFAAGHPIFGQGRAPIYLGHCPSVDAGGRTHWFAVDISTWEPEAGAPAVEAFLDPSEIVHPSAPDARFVELRAHLTSFDEGWGESALPPRVRLRSGMSRTGSARPAGRKARWRMRVGSGAAKAVAPRISRAPIRW